MAGFPSLPLFVKDYLVDTTALTLEQSGAYLHLLMHAWARGGSLPDCDRTLASFCKVSVKKWAAIRPHVEGYFTVENGTWTNRRLAQEWQYVKGVSEKRAAAGAKGGAAPRHKVNNLPEQMLEPGLSKAEAPTLTPTPIVEEEPSGSPSTISRAPEADFDAFWAAYPRRVGKEAARKAWAGCLKRGVQTWHMIEGAQWLADHPPDDPQFIPHPSTWLNQGRYDDERTINAGRQGNRGSGRAAGGAGGFARMVAASMGS